MYKQLLLTGISIAGVIFTSITSAAAYSKSQKQIEEVGCELTFKEKFKMVGKNYILPTVLCTITIGSIIVTGRHTFKVERQLQGMSNYAGVAYGMLEKYRAENIKRYGKEVDDDIFKTVIKDEVDYDRIITAQSPCDNTTLNVPSAPEEKMLFALKLSPNCPTDGDIYMFEQYYSNVLQAEYHINRNFVLGGAVSKGDFLNFLGLELHEDDTDDVWICDGDYYWIDFYNHEGVVDGVNCCIIEPEFYPMPESDYFV